MAELETLAAVLGQEQIADFLGVSRPTLAAMIERDAEISLRYKKGRARTIADVAGGLLQRAREGDTASAIFYLKTQAGWRETLRSELTGSDGGLIKAERVTHIEVVGIEDAEEFTWRISDLAARSAEVDPLPQE